MNNSDRTLLAFLVGATAGAMAGLLLAPTSGKETRKKISDRATDIASNIKHDMEEKIDVGSKKIKDAVLASKEKLTTALKN